MKQLLIVLLIVISYTPVFSQTNGAQINIYDLRTTGNEYKFNCEVKTPDNSDAKTIFCLVRSNSLLQLALVNNNKNLVLNSNDATLTLNVQDKDRANEMYVVVASGNVNSINKSLLLVDGEFSNINDVLNVLYKSGVTPLTYKQQYIN